MSFKEHRLVFQKSAKQKFQEDIKKGKKAGVLAAARGKDPALIKSIEERFSKGGLSAQSLFGQLQTTKVPTTQPTKGIGEPVSAGEEAKGVKKPKETIRIEAPTGEEDRFKSAEELFARDDPESLLDQRIKEIEAVQKRKREERAKGHEQELETLGMQQKIQADLAAQEFETQKKQAEAAAAGARSAFAQDREGPVSATAPLLVQQFQESVQTQLDQSMRRIDLARFHRSDIEQRLRQAQQQNRVELEAQLQGELARVEARADSARAEAFAHQERLANLAIRQQDQVRLATESKIETLEAMGSSIAGLSTGQLSTMIEGTNLTMPEALTLQKAIELEGLAAEAKTVQEAAIFELEASKLRADIAEIGKLKPTGPIQNFQFFQELKDQGATDEDILEFQRLTGTAPDQLSALDQAKVAEIYNEISDSPGLQGAANGVANEILAASSAQGFKTGHLALDYTLPGQESAKVRVPVTGQVIDMKNDGERNGGYGNNVLIDVGGVTHRFAHLSSVDANIKVGTLITAGQAIGNQGKTGNVQAIGPTGTGVHVHYEITNADGTKVDPAVFLQGLKEESISAQDEIAINNLAVDIWGKRAGSTSEKINLVKRAYLDAGGDIDTVRDNLRFSEQSILFSGEMRDAAESISIGLDSKKVETFQNSLDRSLENEDIERARDLLKRTAIQAVGTEEQKQIRGKDRTVEFLNEIKGDLEQLEAQGIDTGIFTGAHETVMNAIGRTKDPAVARVQTKIQLAIQGFRRAMSGVAFSVPESKEYQAIFPSLDKVEELNLAKLQALDEVFGGELDTFYGQMMGDAAYDKIFKGGDIQGMGSQANAFDSIETVSGDDVLGQF